MSNKFTNDFYEFRRKVAQGREKNAIAHTGLINVDELNERNLRNQFEKNTLIHAGTNQNKDYKYYNKIELPNGDTRYFYTKAEWDAYQEGKNRDAYNAANAAKKTSGGASAQADIEAEARNKYEAEKNQKTDLESVETKKERERQWNYIQNFNREYDSKFSEIARTSGAEAAAKEIVKEPHTRNLLDTISKGFESGKLTYKDGKFETSDEDLQKQIESDSDSLEKLLKGIDKNAGTGKDVKKAVEKIIVSKIEELNDKNKYSSKVDSKKVAESDQKIIDMVRNKADAKSVAEEYVNSEKATKFLQGLIKEAQEGNYDFSRKDIDDVIDADTMSKATSQGLRNLRDDVEDHIEDLLDSIIEGQDEEYSDKFKDDFRRAYTKAILDRFEEMFEVAKKTDSKLGRVGKLSNGREVEKTAKTINHSSEESDSLTTNGVMSEYRAFKERANKGAAKNKLVHSTFISPEELNARYEEEQRSKCILVHSANYKYYNKIDLGNGNTRYFYTKAEWDAYQDGLGQAKYREHQNTVNQMKKETAERAAQAQKIADQKQEASNRANMGGYEEYQKNKAEKEKAAENEKKKEYASQKSGMTGYNKYQENLKADQEANARQKEIDIKKEVSAQKSGMTDYNKYQENLKADQEADRREKQKVEASQRSGMEGYNDYKKYKSAKDEADRRNDAEGLEKFQAKKKAEEDLKKQRAETVAKNKAADEAKKASEDEQHREEKNARLTAEKEAKEAKDAKIADLTDQLNKTRSGNAKEATSSREAAEAAGRKTEYDRLNDARDAEHESDKETRKMREKYAAAGEKATNILDNTLKPYNNKLKDLNDKYDNLKDKSSPEAKAIKSQISSIETERDNKFDKVYNELMDEMDAEYNKLLKSGNKTEAAELNSMRNAVKSAYEVSPEEIKEMFPLYYNVTHTTASTAGDGKKGHKF